MFRRFVSEKLRVISRAVAGAKKPPVRGSEARTWLTVESLEGRVVLSLTPVSPNAGYPYTTIVQLTATFPDHKVFTGSGVMVDSYHVLTAGHVVYSSADGGFATSIVATPEQYGATGRFGSATMTHMTTYTTFINYDKAHPHRTAPGDMDIALMSLNRNIGNSTSWMSYGYDNNNASFSQGKIFNTAGYPGSAGGYDGHHMQFSSGPIAGLSSDGNAIQFYQSSITTYAGQSGSPLWSYTPSTGSRVVYGIFVGGDNTSTSLNFATRITKSIYTDLGNWISQDNGVRRPSTNAAGLGSSESSGTSPISIPLMTSTTSIPVIVAATIPSAKTARLAAFRFAS